jgi:hypothetical protein
MNQEKAREFFSDYREGTLDAGLRQSFEQALRSNSKLRGEFSAFETAMSQLDDLRFEIIEVPADLHDRIAARIDRHAVEQRATSAPAWALWTRNLAVACVAAVAVLGALVSLGRQGGSSSVGAAVVAPAPAADQLKLSQIAGGVEVSYTARGRREFVVREGVDGEELRRVRLQGQPLKSPLINPHAAPALMSIHVDSEPTPTVVALPGTERSTGTSGEGTLAEFALAMAGFYGLPVVVDVDKPGEEILSWEFASLEPLVAASRTLESRYVVELRATGILYIQSH